MMKTVSMDDIKGLYKPPRHSHKGHNGRLLVIGGSTLFHASIFWSADVASRVVDLVHFTSPAKENNEAVRLRIKEGFWSGIVVDWGEVEDYIAEDDCVLIGPGMVRGEETAAITNRLLEQYPDKLWVVDGGALQEADPALLRSTMIITPHRGEWERLASKCHGTTYTVQNWDDVEERGKVLAEFSVAHRGVTIVAKGVVDVIAQGDRVAKVEGGNAGMTKGGTGDVLAGLVAALYCKNEAWLAAVAASWGCKRAGDKLYERVGVYFNAGDLVGEVGEVMGKIEV